MNEGSAPRPNLPFPLPEPLAALLSSALGRFTDPGGVAGLADRLPRLPELGLGQAALERLTLLINHVLSAEPEAMARLAPHADRRLQVVWTDWPSWLPLPAEAAWTITRAGLLDLDPVEPAAGVAPGDLTVQLDTRSVATWALQAPVQAASGEAGRPPMSVQGDADLAAAVAWLADHLRWDIEDDLARLIGDGPAHWVGQLGRSLVVALRGLLAPLGR